MVKYFPYHHFQTYCFKRIRVFITHMHFVEVFFLLHILIKLFSVQKVEKYCLRFVRKYIIKYSRVTGRFGNLNCIC